MRPYLFKIGSFELRIYSLMYIIALFLAIYIAKRDDIAKKRGIDNLKLIEDFAFNEIFFGLAGARLYYVFLRWDLYQNAPLDALKVWQGGLAIHGGIIGGIIGAYIFSKLKSYNFWVLTDMAVGPLLLGQGLGRIGNLANGEIHGVPTFTPLSVILKGNFNSWWEYYNSLDILARAKFKDLVPWGIVFPSNTQAGIEFPNYALHPAMIYEMILNFIGFYLIWFIFRKKEYKVGVLSMIYLITYGIIRYIVSMVRAEDLYFMGIKAPYIVSILMIVVAIIGIMYFNRKKAK
ncbi:prolipoprotein diacylglyceryl transferase [Oceanivirga miroungae]|uniref:Phosphatidylglycerol--prolipoprotein diacylglyceryl transferase n=1 Tax=Oceanivirga miroungae TaxID=1130046 RepID=A0A6I8MDN7_9FUSO|nr:prolipoprotein diacylglyceryl transferase [Oceanivirga miroungae]VWL85284.1 prolipoprotein diacylglyceryl transferase [Oceanivirga miroungae]